MTSQSTLGDDIGIAEELAESQRAISIAEFFEKNKHMLGFDSGARGLVTAVKEGVDNALDAGEEADILPDIYVEIEDIGDYYRVVIEDNGPGITREQLPKVFGKLLYGSRFHAREQSLTPDQRILVRRNGNLQFLPIGVLCDAYLPASGAATRRIPDKIEVPSFTRDDHELTWQPVTHAIRHETDEQTYEINTERGRSVEVTGHHSVFTLDGNGGTEAVTADKLESGDYILAPQQLPRPGEPIETVNLLQHLTPEQLADHQLYVHGLDLPVNRFKQEYHEHGYLPAETVLELGWEDRAADGVLTATPDADGPAIPVSVPVEDHFLRLLGQYLSEGTIDPQQAEAVIDTTRINALAGSASVTGHTDSVASDTPLAVFLRSVCGETAEEQRLPEFVFELSPADQRTVLTALDQSEASSAGYIHTTSSKPLARQLSTLWNMQGVLAHTETVEDPSSDVVYRTRVSEDALPQGPTGDRSAAGHAAIPVSLLEDVQVDAPGCETVPGTIAGLLRGAGIGTSIEQAKRYRSLIERALAGDALDVSPAADHLREYGLLDDAYAPTDALRSLWERVQTLQEFVDSDMCLLAVTAIEETSPPDYVYDISVPGATGNDENFVVSNQGAISVKNSRGQQGIGISAAVLYSQLTSGKPAKITSRTQRNDEAQYFELVIDTDTNEPEIREERTTTWDRPHGTRIELEMEATMRARTQLHEYIKHTAVVNPHARIELREPGLDEPLKFERATDQLPAETEEIRPHPHGVELGTLLKMLDATDSHSVSGFLQSEFTRVGRKTADSIIDAFRDRYYGRAFAWSTPGPQESIDVAGIVREATANKGQAATDDFADRVASVLAERERIAHHDLQTIVGNAADAVADAHDRTIGETVRANVTEALWAAIATPDRRRADCYRVIDEVTTARKDDTTVDGVASRLADVLDAETDSRDRVTADELATYVDRAADMTEDREEVTFGETARENVREALWDHTRTVPDEPPKLRTFVDDRDTASDLLEAMRSVSVLSPPTSCLSPITADLIEAGLKKEYDADFYTATTRDAEVHGGDPFVVEAGIAYGGELADGTMDLMRFANRVPLVYQRGACAITDVVKSIGWRNYKLDQPGGSGLPNGPVVLMIHVASTNVPFTSESKDALANVPEIEDEIELAVREAARDLKSYLKKKRSMQQRQRKRNKLADILPEMAEKVAEVTGRDEPDYGDALARIMNNVLIERHAEAAEDGTRTVHLTVENHTNTNESFDVTEIVSTEPTDLPDDATAVEVDGEYFIKWTATVDAGEQTALSYTTAADAEFDLSVDGIETAKLTVAN